MMGSTSYLEIKKFVLQRDTYRLRSRSWIEADSRALWNELYSSAIWWLNREVNIEKYITKSRIKHILPETFYANTTKLAFKLTLLIGVKQFSKRPLEGYMQCFTKQTLQLLAKDL